MLSVAQLLQQSLRVRETLQVRLLESLGSVGASVGVERATTKDLPSVIGIINLFLVAVGSKHDHWGHSCVSME